MKYEPVLCDGFWEENMPDGLREYTQSKWVAEFGIVLQTKCKEPPIGYAIVKSGRVRPGDVFGNIFVGWDLKRPLKEEHTQVVGTPVGHFHAVARKTGT